MIKHNITEEQVKASAKALAAAKTPKGKKDKTTFSKEDILHEVLALRKHSDRLTDILLTSGVRIL